MSAYDFKSLSSYDFEVITRDLLQKELKITLQSFKSGRDGGIDLRYSRNYNRNIVVQCKHFACSTYSSLKNHIKNEELLKIKKLKPKRYILATSLGLTPGNKEELRRLLRPYCKVTDDIYGCDDLNNLLGKFPQIEQKHFKLWLTSTVVLERILHSEILNRTGFEVDHIQRKLCYYVQNKSFYEAIRILDNLHYCIVAGIPGIGKTTLAEVILIDYLMKGYEAIKISGHIKEAIALYGPEKKQLFYYDDFLGQTTLEQKMDKNEDQDLLRFCETIQKSKNHRFILTTREYILNAAKLTYEKIAQSGIDIKKCIIDLSSYSKVNRAQILYNHLYFSDIPDEFKRELLSKKSYWKIVNHRNYNPRIIEWMTIQFKAQAISDKGYLDLFLENLNNPERLWAHAFENQLSSAAQSILLALATMPPEVFITDLEQCFGSLHKMRLGQTSINPVTHEYHRSLRQIEGNFIKTNKSESHIIVSFHNPSIKDFLDNYIRNNPGDIKLLLNSFMYYDQCIQVWRSAKENMKKELISYSGALLESMKRTFNSGDLRLIDTYSVSNSTRTYIGKRKWSTTKEDRVIFAFEVLEVIPETKEIIAWMIRQLAISLQKGSKDKEGLIRLFKLIKQCDYQFIEDKQEFIELFKKALISELDEIRDYKYILEGIKIEKDLFSDGEKYQLSESFENNHYQLATQEIEQETYLDDAKDILEKLLNIGEYFSVDISLAKMRVDDRINALEEDERNQEEIDLEESYKSYEDEEDKSDRQIEAMFDSLI